MCRLSDILTLEHISRTRGIAFSYPRTISIYRSLEGCDPHPSDSSKMEARGIHQTDKVMCQLL